MVGGFIELLNDIQQQRCVFLLEEDFKFIYGTSIVLSKMHHEVIVKSHQMRILIEVKD